MELLDQLVETVTDFVSQVPGIVPVLVSLILGIALVGWGYSIFRIWLTLFGMYSGYRAGVWLGGMLELESQPYWIVVLLITIAITLLFALALKVSIFIAGTFLGMFLVNQLSMSLLGLNNRIVTVVGGIILGILAAAFIKFFIVLGTAISGSYLVTDAVFSLISTTEAGTWLNANAPARDFIPITMQVLTVVLVVLGCIAQYKFTDRGRRVRLHGRNL